MCPRLTPTRVLPSPVPDTSPTHDRSRSLSHLLHRTMLCEVRVAAGAELRRTRKRVLSRAVHLNLAQHLKPLAYDPETDQLFPKTTASTQQNTTMRPRGFVNRRTRHPDEV